MADSPRLSDTATADRTPATSASDGGTPARLRRWESHRTRERLAQLLFLVPAAVYMVAFFGYPIVKNFLMAFQKYSTSTFYTGEAPWVGLDNYRAVVSSSVF